MSLSSIDKLISNKKISYPDEEIKRVVNEAVFKVADINISIDNISYINRVIHLDTTPSKRSVIHIKKQKIIKSLKDKLGKRAPKEIH